ncbi:MAG: methionine biosynthesis protein MetW, partial [Opitutales bacterium]|nr:methionine biosynthesis protein MetW [Opitutales bacterium]
LVIDESLRVGKRVVIGFVNYGYWYNRLHLALKGRRTVNKVFENDWYCARPMNQISIVSFKEFCANNDIAINRSHFLRGNWRTQCKFLPNLMAGYALFEISKK